MMLLVLIVFGLIFGSFINALVWRLHEGRDFIGGRSECTHCHHMLSAKDLVPVISYLWLRGKCRYCKKPIADTPFAELLLPCWFALSYLFWPLPLTTHTGIFQLVAWLSASVVLVALLVYDKRWFLLPDKMTYPLAAFALLVLIIRVIVLGEPADVLVGAAVAALIISGTFYLLFQLSKGAWIGGGDVKLGLALGLFAGDPLKALLLLFVASLGGTLFMLPSMLRGKASRKMQIPFGPFLIGSLLVVYIFGTRILDAYFGLLNV